MFTAVERVSDLIDVPADQSQFGNASLQRRELPRQQWRERSQVRAN
jgi:hypothetical protein